MRIPAKVEVAPVALKEEAERPAEKVEVAPAFTVSAPDVAILKAATEDVANASEEVAIYRAPPAERKDQCLRLAPADGSERVS